MHIVILVHLLYPKRPLKDYMYWGDELTSVTIRTHIFDQSEAEKLSQIHTQTDRESTYCQALLYEQRLQKSKLSIKFKKIFIRVAQIDILFESVTQKVKAKLSFGHNVVILSYSRLNF